MFLAMKRSQDALFALGFFVLMVLVVFSTLLYFAERGIWDETLQTFVNDGEPSQFDVGTLDCDSRHLLILYFRAFLLQLGMICRDLLDDAH